MSENAEDLKIEYVPLSTVQRWPRNPKKHAMDLLDKSLSRFGYTQPMMVDERTGKLVAGHGRLDTLLAQRLEGKPAPTRIRVREDGEWMVPVIRGVRFKNDMELEAYLLADNRTTELGGWDTVGLNAILSSLQDVADVEDLIQYGGWSAAEVDSMLAEAAAGATGEFERGLTPEEKLEGFNNAAIKQIVLLYPSDRIPSIVTRLEAVAQAFGLEDNAEVLEKLLEFYEAHQSSAS